MHKDDDLTMMVVAAGMGGLPFIWWIKIQSASHCSIGMLMIPSNLFQMLTSTVLPVPLIIFLSPPLTSPVRIFPRQNSATLVLRQRMNDMENLLFIDNLQGSRQAHTRPIRSSCPDMFCFAAT